MRPVVQEIVLDCADPAALAQFWAGLLESRWALLHPGWAVVDADPVLIAFQQVPEPKSSPKNRLHLDVQVDDAAAWTARAEAAGARRISDPETGPDGDGYVVLADPEGNELCLVVDNGGRWRAAARAALDAAPAVEPLPVV
jgi:catechol 2,3-dioxygenase-like lactoylglutathione lyase family enzyme